MLKSLPEPIKAALRPIRNTIATNVSIWSWLRSDSGQRTLLRLNELKDSMKGCDAILMCNGPSLNKVPFEELIGGPFLFGMNKINLLFDRTEMRPDMIVAVNPFVIQQNADFFNQTQIELMLSKAGSSFVESRKGLNLLNTSPYLRFTNDPGSIIYEGWTVTYVTLQIAFHMGFRRVAIVGADHNYRQSGKPNELQVYNGPDQNHFDPRYFGYGAQWQLADLDGSERAYILARQKYEAAGRELYNCTEGGFLEIFKRMPLQDFLKSGKRHRQ